MNVKCIDSDISGRRLTKGKIYLVLGENKTTYTIRDDMNTEGRWLKKRFVENKEIDTRPNLVEVRW